MHLFLRPRNIVTRLPLIMAGLFAVSPSKIPGIPQLNAQEVQTNGAVMVGRDEELPPPNIQPPLDEGMVASDRETLVEVAELEANSTPPMDRPGDREMPPMEFPAVAEPPLPEEPWDTGNLIVGEGRTGWRKNVFPHFRIGGFYDDNIFIQNKDRQGDYIGFVGFGLRAGLGEVSAPLYTLREARNVPIIFEAPPQPAGNFILADYSGTLFGFANHSSENSYDQDALLSMGWSGSKLSLGLEGRFQSLSGSDIDVGNRVRRNIYSGGLNSRYEISDKSSLEANVAYIATHYEGLIDSGEWIGETWYNYQLTPKVKVAAGLSGGVLQIEDASSQPYGRLFVRSTYQYSEKLAFSGRLGLEYRDVDHGSGFGNNPIFTLGATYAPWDGTDLGLSAYRLVEASATLVGEDYTRTGVDLKIRQRFLQRFYFSITGGYENLDYRRVEETTAPSRRDNYFFGRAAVAFDVGRWCNATVFYQFQRDSSTLADQSFTSNQAGLEINFAF